MRHARTLLSIALVLHGLAHASAGMWASGIGGGRLATVLWELAAVGFIATAAALLGVGGLRQWRSPLIIVASLSSLALLTLYSHPLFVAGMVADLVLAAIVLAPAGGGQLAALSPIGRITRMALVGLLFYVAAAIALRPWHSAWGATRSERLMVLAGDPPLGESAYRIDHALTIHAPVDSIWPSVMQLASGQKVTHIENGRSLTLEGWRTLALDPVDSASTRLHLRLRGEGIPTLSGIALTPLALLVLEPAHFISERGMMLEMKRRVERQYR